MRLLALGLWLTTATCVAQVNTRSVLAMGRNALFYQDYVAALQYFTMCVNAKPYLGEAYYYRALSRFYLGDYLGADADATLCLDRNPYIPNLLPLRAICRSRMGRYAEAERDYTAILKMRRRDESAWHNLVMCQVEQGDYYRADFTLALMAATLDDDADAAALRRVVSDARLGLRTAAPAPALDLRQ